MIASQINLDGRTKVEESIKRLQEYVPAEGYFLAFSGGKDSVVLYDLVVRSGVKFDAHYSQTGIDPPELVQFIRANYPDVIWEKPKERIWSLVQRKGLPMRIRRFCCQYLKEQNGIGRTLATGIRSSESSRRKHRHVFEKIARQASDSGSFVLHPIVDWLESDVWAHLHNNNLPYCSLYDEGFKRLGCVLCPMTSSWDAWKEYERWPKLGEAWKRAAIRRYAVHEIAHEIWPSGEAMFNWWMSREPLPKKSEQMVFGDYIDLPTNRPDVVSVEMTEKAQTIQGWL